MITGFVALDWLGAPNMTPPVKTVVFPPSYGVTSILDLSTKTRPFRALSRRDCLCSFCDAGVEDADEEDATDADVNDKPELELDERELQREWLEIVEIREGGRGIGNWSMIGVSQVGARISSSIIAKSCSSSSLSASNNCWAIVFIDMVG
jgi:hypothetical protein